MFSNKSIVSSNTQPQYNWQEEDNKDLLRVIGIGRGNGYGSGGLSYLFRLFRQYIGKTILPSRDEILDV